MLPIPPIIQKSKLQIIEETVEYYSDATKRASELIEEGRYSCRYILPNGNMCAFGRCEINPRMDIAGGVWSRYRINNQARDIDMLKLNADLKPEYRGHELEFWSDIQGLHDTEEHFSNGTWSIYGHQLIEGLKRRWTHS